MDENNDMTSGERQNIDRNIDRNFDKNFDKNYNKNYNSNYNNRNPRYNRKPIKKTLSDETKPEVSPTLNLKIKTAETQTPQIQSQTQSQIQSQAQSQTQIPSQIQSQTQPKPLLQLKKKPEVTTRPPQPKRDDKSILSVVIPLFNEEDSLPELSLMLESELNKIASHRWEVIFIDDGSTDGSYDIIKRICSRNKNFKAIRFRTNYGKSAALQVGFQEAKGVIVITMDADLQDDPAEIPNLIAKLKEGYDLVSGWKKVRHDPISKTIPSRFFNFVTSKMSGLKLHDFNCGLKAYRREVVKTVQVYGEMHRYIPALAKWEGFRCTEIPIKHHERRYGKSKYGFSRFIKGFLDLITIVFTTRYFKRPLHFFGTIGTILALVGFGTDLYLAIEWFMDNTYLSNRPLALFGIALIIVGVQLFSFGLIGEMYVKNTLEKANYSIRERI